MPACEKYPRMCLYQYLNLPDARFSFRTWNPSTPTSRTPSLPSTHHLRPRRPLCSGRCSAWLRGSTEGMACAASLTSSSRPRGPYSTCSRKPVWVPILRGQSLVRPSPQGTEPVWDPPLRGHSLCEDFPEGNTVTVIYLGKETGKDTWYLENIRYLSWGSGILEPGK